MSYAKKISVKLFYHFRHRLSNIEKIIYLLLIALVIVKVAEFIVDNKQAVAIFMGIIIFIALIYLYLKQKMHIKNNKKLDNLEDKSNFHTNYDINTNGGNYNRLIEGDCIQGDYINIQNNRVDISKDVTSILDDFRVILTKMQNQGYSTEQAVAQMAKELASETRKKPYVKDKFHIDENVDDSEVYDEFIRFLIINNHLLNQKTQYYRVDTDEEDYEEEIDYKGYTIYLESDQDGVWHYKIDDALLSATGEHYFKEFAIDEAKGKIDKERFSNW
ncbi:hypothetical protein DSM106972_099100 [Dulcicalothrix desertica PCC 7102]|uniref:Uncharacterized protein n=1 Tax=Dulcicalothrix desertica PCC 7102 TaxID=232991 RepID=A0A3S1AHM4_9CYAN|nr:hypothetical protein [Dulcicalothrix desertica]RUS92413.1 hypothetical protein DSM106972_099100 [Dulcicalothrix desertica PCC 7102]TWH62842.1 hypothetical protein CAL7102_00377 [Dulcicalothrix desertica PCC 7102]